MSDLHPELQRLARQAKSLNSKNLLLAETLITRLDWEGFTVFVDLLFQRLGWQRRWVIDNFKYQEGMVADFGAIQPALAELAFVQLVEHPTQAIVDRVLSMKKPKGQYHTLFLIAQHPSSLISDGLDDIHYWQGSTLAAKALSVGLLDWLMSELLGEEIY